MMKSIVATSSTLYIWLDSNLISHMAYAEELETKSAITVYFSKNIITMGSTQPRATAVANYWLYQ
jgi:hypothetical protein